MPQNEAIVHPGRRPAPAKLNATLEVLGKRPDGLHTLRSVVIPIALYDEVSWTPAHAFAFTCSDANLAGDDNLVMQAARAIGIDALGIALHLEKHIPYGSGLGGGSSDAAAVLLAAMQGAFGPQPERDWVGIAREIGSDVPLFLVDAPALIEATGERVTALGANAPWWAVLVCPALNISTREAYAQLDAAGSHSVAQSRALSVSIEMTQALQRRNFAAVDGLLCNDFETVMFAQACFSPTIAAFTRAGRTAHLTGSGSSLFALFETETAAQAFARELKEDAADLTSYTVPFAPSGAWQHES